MNIKRKFFQILSELGIHSKVEEPDYPGGETCECGGCKSFSSGSHLPVLFLQ